MAAIPSEQIDRPVQKSGDGRGVGPRREADGAMHEQVFARLRDAIIQGELAPGRTLSVRGLAREFDVSAMPAREAIRHLVAIGALELTETRRVRIASMSAQKLSQIETARVALEPELARLAYERVKNRTREKKALANELKSIDLALDVAIKNGDAADYARLNSSFHMTLYRASDAKVLLGLVESLWLQFGPFMRVIIGRIGTSEFEDDTHKSAVEAILQDSPDELEAAIRSDIVDGIENLRLNIGKDDFSDS